MLSVVHPEEPGLTLAGDVPWFLPQRLDDFIFISDDTVKLLELSVLLLSPLIVLLGHILLGLRFTTLHRLSLL